MASNISSKIEIIHCRKMFKRMTIKAMCHIILNSATSLLGDSYSCIIFTYGKLTKFKLVNLYIVIYIIMLTKSHAKIITISKRYNGSVIMYLHSKVY